MSEGSNQNKSARAYKTPSRDDLLDMAMSVYDMALEKSAIQRDGTEGPSPELNSALKAIELMGKLTGILGDGRTMTRAQLERELDQMGYRLVPKLREAK